MWNWVAKLEELRLRGVAATVVTVVEVAGSVPREVGAKMIVLEDGTFFGTIGGGHLEQLAIEDARRSLDEGRATKVRYPLGAKTGQCCGGIVELLFETVNRGPRLYVFGAGHVGQAVCRTLAGTPFQVHLIDERPEWIDAKDLPEGVIRHPCEWDEFVREAEWRADRTYAVVMTYRHDTDQAIVADLLGRQLKYLGLIGSRAKWARFRDRLTARGITSTALDRVKCPIGIRVGGKAPQEIAISLAAELLTTHYEERTS